MRIVKPFDFSAGESGSDRFGGRTPRSQLCDRQVRLPCREGRACGANEIIGASRSVDGVESEHPIETLCHALTQRASIVEGCGNQLRCELQKRVASFGFG